MSIGRWVLREACAQLAAWADALPPATSLCRSTSPRASSPTRASCDSVLSALRDAGVEPGRLSLELTETVLIQQEGALDVWRRQGSGRRRVVLDDFGTGYSSLS